MPTPNYGPARFVAHCQDCAWGYSGYRATRAASAHSTERTHTVVVHRTQSRLYRAGQSQPLGSPIVAEAPPPPT